MLDGSTINHSIWRVCSPALLLLSCKQASTSMRALAVPLCFFFQHLSLCMQFAVACITGSMHMCL
jgi:hypothetical protein